MADAPVQRTTARRPATLVLQHYKENRRKCSLEPLRPRPDFEFRTIKPIYPNPALVVPGGVVLAVDAPIIDPRDRSVFEHPDARMIVVDGTWTKIRSVVRHIVPVDAEAPLVFRSLPEGLATAYPRHSKLTDDPRSGLASVEALVAAFRLMDYPALDLLEGYLWREEFVARNPVIC